MRIAFFHELQPGGARRAVLEFAKELKTNNQVDLYYLESKREKKEEKTFNKSYFYKFIPRKWTGNDWKSKLYKDTVELYRLYSLHQKIAKKIDQGNYDFAFIHGSRYTQAPFVLRFLKTKSVYYCQEPLRMVYEDLFKIPEELSWERNIYERINRNNRRLIDKSNAKKANLILAISKFTQKNIKSYLGLDSVVSYMGINSKVFFPERSKKIYDILFVGSRNDMDGYKILKDAIKRMKKKPKVRWLLSEEEWIDDDSKMRGLYSSSRILTCLAYKEPFGLLPIEAQACGTVVIATHEGGHLETVSSKSGVFINRNPKSLSDALTKLLGDQKKMSELSANGVSNARQNWTWEVTTKRLIENIKSNLEL